jgi:DNA-binding transcriptional MocR family regulator
MGQYPTGGDLPCRDLAWWASVVFDGWRDRPGPRYQRLAACLLDAVSRRVLAAGTRVPAERQLAMVVGVSRGTVVACFEHLVAAGVLRRRVGAGTFVVGPPSWASSVRDSGRGVAELLLRRLAGDLPVIDLSASCPGDVRHLPGVPSPSLAELDGNGLDPRGLLSLRTAIASHLTRFGRLPTTAEQIVVCAGAQEALWLLGRVLRPPRVLVSCPTYPGLAGAFGSGFAVVPGDVAGTTAVEASRAPGGSCVFVMPDGHNPTGLVMSGVRRQAFASLADAERVLVIEDMALADLSLSGGFGLPLAALSPAVIAVGSVSKLLWGGLRIGWIRVGVEASGLLDALLARKASLNLATSSVAQAYAAQLLAAVSPSWLASHRLALAARRNHLVSLLGALLPAWRVDVVPSAGLSLWVRLPVLDAAAFAFVASRHGVTVAPGAAACVCGSHRGHVRLSFAEQLDTLTLAVERLAVAWEAHTQTLAAAPLS